MTILGLIENSNHPASVPKGGALLLHSFPRRFWTVVYFKIIIAEDGTWCPSLAHNFCSENQNQNSDEPTK